MSEKRLEPEQEKILDHWMPADAANPSGLTEADLCGWLGAAAPGDRLEYHRGFLALDIRPDGSRLAPADRRALARVAARAYWAAEQGWAHLVQRRNGPDDFTYMIVARPRSHVARGALVAALAQALPE